MSSSPELTVGQRVEAAGKKGTIRFIGKTQFATGEWIGVELDEALGKNDGSIKGVKYFGRTSSPDFVSNLRGISTPREIYLMSNRTPHASSQQRNQSMVSLRKELKSYQNRRRRRPRKRRPHRPPRGGPDCVRPKRQESKVL